MKNNRNYVAKQKSKKAWLELMQRGRQYANALTEIDTRYRLAIEAVQSTLDSIDLGKTQQRALERCVPSADANELMRIRSRGAASSHALL